MNRHYAIKLSVGAVFLAAAFFCSSIIKESFQKKALGADNNQQLFISSSSYYSRGGLISFTSKSDPTVTIGSNIMKGDATVDIYEVGIGDVLKSLQHDEKGNQIIANPDLGRMQKIASFTQAISPGFENGSKVSLPLEGTGEWFVNVTLYGEKTSTFIVRSDIGALVREGDSQMIFWVQDISSKKSIEGANVKVYDLQGKIDERYSVNSGDDGIARTPISSKDDVAIVKKGGDEALIPINLKYINTGYNYKSFVEKNVGKTSFTFVDRPLYSPGDKIYFKSIIREDDDARYSVAKGDVNVEIFKGWGSDREIVSSKKFAVSLDGTVSGEFNLPKDIKTGGYYLGLIEAGKKVSNPEMGPAYFSQTSFSVEYYQKPEYSIDLSVEKSELISGDDLTFSVNGSYFSGQPLSGRDVDYKIYSSDYYDYSYYNDNHGYDFSNDYRYGYRGGSTVTEGKATLDENGHAMVSFKAEIPDDKNRKSKIFSIEVELKDDSSNPSFESKNVLVKSGEFGIYRTEGTYGGRTNQEITLPLVTMQKVANKELAGEITRTWWERKDINGSKYPYYNRMEDNISTVSVTTDSDGKAAIKFTPSQEGSYNVRVEGFDNRGNRITKTFYFWISDDKGYYSGDSGSEQTKGLTVKVDKEEYKPSDVARLNIHSETPDRDVFLSLERGRSDRFQIVHVKGNNAVVDLQLQDSDMPEMTAYVGSFSDTKMETYQDDIKVPATSKKISISIIPNKSEYAPGDIASFNVKTFDYKGNPVSAELALWSVDKALFELMNSSNGDIYKAFWHERYDSTAGSDSLVGILIDSAEKGGGGGDARQVFKDTAFWDPNVRTDKNGFAKVSFKLPDNLTTWVLSAVGSTKDTMVGQATNEIKVTKNVIIRPALPNILRNDNEITIAATAQNFTDKSETFSAKLEFDAGDVEDQVQNVTIDSKSSVQVFWRVHPKEEKENAVMKFSLIGPDKNNSDVVIRTIPMRKFGFWETNVEVGADKSEFMITPSADADQGKTELNLSISSSLLGSLPSSMKYLIGYPYGCLEQTTSRFVPAVLAKENQKLLNESIDGKNLDDFIKVGVERLKSKQNYDGGWGWWGGKTDSYISIYVTEFLLRARNAGADVDDGMLVAAKKYFEKEPDYLNDKSSVADKYANDIIRAYGLSLFGEKKIIDNFDQDTSPDIMALAVMSNVRNGFNDTTRNGRDKLMSMASTEGDGKLFWKSGTSIRFGSVDTSTGMALRAFLMAGGDKDTAQKVVRFLADERKTNYWTSTFATVQVIQSMIDFSKIEKMIFPNYSYDVMLDGTKIASGTFNSKNWEDDILVPVDKIKSSTSMLTISKKGEGQMYSELLTKEFHLNDNAVPLDKGIKISRSYINEKGSNFSIGVGDVVNVELRVSGDYSKDNHMVIEDQLPAGLVPINPLFKNSQYENNNDLFDQNMSIKEVKENGVVMAAYGVILANNVYHYKARVVSEGDFLAPPATASLMYSPDVYGHSGVQRLNVVRKSEAVPQNLASYLSQVMSQNEVSKKLYVWILGIAALAILTAIGIFVYQNKRKKTEIV